MTNGQRTSFEPNQAVFEPLYTHGLVGSCAVNPEQVLVLPCDSRACLVKDKALEHHPLAAEDDVVTCVALAPGATKIFVAGRSGFASLATLEEPRKRPRVFRPFENGVVAYAAFDASAGLLAAATSSSSVRVFDADAGHVTHSLEPPADSLTTALTFHPTSEAMKLLVGSENGKVHVFDLATRSRKACVSMSHHVAAVFSIEFANSGRFVVASGRDRVISVSRLSDGKKVRLMVCNENVADATTVPALKDRLLTVGDTGMLRVWDVLEGAEMKDMATPIPLIHDSAEIVGDDEEASEVRAVNITASGTESFVVSLSDQTVLEFALKASSRPFLSRALCGNVEQVNDLRCCTRAPNEGTQDNSTTSQASGELLEAVVAFNSSTVWVLDTPVETPDRQLAKQVATGEQSDTTGNPSSTSRAPVLEAGSALLSPRATRPWRCRKALSGHRGIVLALDVVRADSSMPDKKSASSLSTATYAVTGSRDRTARVFGKAEGGDWACLAVAEGHTDDVTAVALSSTKLADNMFIVTAANDRTLKRWSLRQTLRARPDDSSTSQSGENELFCRAASSKLSADWTVLAHEKDINAVAVSPDSRVIATGSQDRLVKIWSVGGKLEATCRGHRRGIFSVRFSPVDRVLASSSGDGSVRVWDFASGTCLQSFQGHMGGVLNCTFLSRGTQLASSGTDGIMKVWGVRGGECHATLDAHDDNVWALDSVDDGQTLVTGGMDGRIRVWSDVTKTRADEAAEQRDQDALLIQKVSDAVERGRWSLAVSSALSLDMPQKLRSIVERISTTQSAPDETLVEIVRSIATEEDFGPKLGRFLQYVRDWNAAGGTRNAGVAARCLSAVFQVLTPEGLCDAVPNDKRALVEALVAHTTRHQSRVADLSARARFLDYTLEAMKALPELRAGSHTGTAKRRAGEAAAVALSTKALPVVKRQKKGRQGAMSDY